MYQEFENNLMRQFLENLPTVLFGLLIEKLFFIRFYNILTFFYRLLVTGYQTLTPWTMTMIEK